MADSNININANDRTGRAFAAVQRNLQNLSSATTAVEGPFNRVSGRISAVSTALGRMNPLMVGAGLAMSGVTIAFSKGVKAAGELERVNFRLEALIKATGGAAGVSARHINELAESLDRNTLASAQGVREAAGVLLTFKSIAGETFDRTIKTAQDMAAVFGTDVKQATVQLAKALEDPERGLSALRRSGVSFTEAEKEMIVAMFDAGEEAKAQGLILDALAGQVGGAAQGEAQGLVGSVDSLAFHWNKLMETIGGGAVGQAAKAFIDEVTESIEYLNNLLRDPTDSERLNTAISDRTQLVYDYIDAQREGDSKDTDIAFRRLKDNLAEINMLKVKIFSHEEEEKAIKEKSEALRKARIEEKKNGAPVEIESKGNQKVIENLERSLLSQEQLIGDSYARRIRIINDNVADEEKAAHLKKEVTKKFESDLTEFLIREREKRGQFEVDKQLPGFDESIGAESFEARIQFLKDHNALVEETIKEHHKRIAEERDKLRTAELAKNQMILSASSSMLGSLADITEQWSGKQSKTYKALFIASKAFAVAESIVKIMQGIAGAAAVPFPGNLPAIASTTAATASIVPTIKKTNLNFAGNFEHGGSIGPGEFGFVAEAGAELVNRPGFVQGPAHVTSARETARMLASGIQQRPGNNIVVNINVKSDGGPVPLSSVNQIKTAVHRSILRASARN